MSQIMFVETFRIKVYVIEECVEKVLNAVQRVTNLKYGNYDGVSWCSHPGVERCTPREGSDTWGGSIGEPFFIGSIQIEFSIPRDKELLSKVVEMIFESHPWDEPVISIFESVETRKNGVI
ncbi:hypothetical protein [Oceanisphaera psychrotolerans]|uniref:NGG1p interacting factor NIF3 n=1 Tax=Oceanisphaera psychrotolerans TaxID=1414654 RepID=A0A1J4QFE3_9GAMM|nr:hypothetical protein [Oceanisphaera psychrotolerans]OIN09146.1 hypothetical protein BFR47_02405 [Oceanisphaera psychrotolerans]